MYMRVYNLGLWPSSYSNPVGLEKKERKGCPVKYVQRPTYEVHEQVSLRHTYWIMVRVQGIHQSFHVTICYNFMLHIRTVTHHS